MASCDHKEIRPRVREGGKAEKGWLLDEFVHATGWTRDHARKGAAHQKQRKPRPRKYSCGALVVLQEVSRLSGQHLAAIMDDALGRLVRFRELGKVEPRVTSEVLDRLDADVLDTNAAPHLARARAAEPGTHRETDQPGPAPTHRPRRRTSPRHPPRRMSHAYTSREESINHSRTS